MNSKDLLNTKTVAYLALASAALFMLYLIYRKAAHAAGDAIDSFEVWAKKKLGIDQGPGGTPNVSTNYPDEASRGLKSSGVSEKYKQIANGEVTDDSVGFGSMEGYGIGQDGVPSQATPGYVPVYNDEPLYNVPSAI